MWNYATAVWPKAYFARVPKLDTSSDLALAVRDMVFGIGHETIPCDFHKVCDAGGFKLRTTKFRSNRSAHDALLIPRRDGTFVILVDPNREELSIGQDTKRHRLRFRIAHEIGHSFFFNRTICPPERVFAPSQEEEAFCDNFASALLVPKTALDRYRCEPRSVFDIHETFELSVEAAARALTRSCIGTTIVGTIWKANPRNGRLANRVIWFTGPRFVPIGADLGSFTVDESCAGKSCSGTEQLKVGDLKGQFYIEAERRQHSTHCVAVIRPV